MISYRSVKDMNLMVNNSNNRTMAPFFSSLFIAAGVFMGFRELITPSPLNLLVSMLCSIIGVVMSGVLKNDFNRAQFFRVLLLVVIAWIFNVFSVFVQGGLNVLRLATLAYMIFTVTVTFIMVKRDLNLIPLKALFYYISFFFIYKLFVLGDSPDDIFSVSAGGMMVTILMTIAIPVQLLEFRRSKKVFLIPPIVILVISVFSLSRTGMLCAALYFIIIMGTMTFQSSKKKVWGYLFFSVLVSIIVYAVVKYWDEIMALEMYEKFEERGVDVNGRDDIWKQYLEEMDLLYLFFGRNIDKVHQLAGFANTHNSYIQLHSQIGILAFIYIYYYLRVCVYYMRHNWFSLLLLIVFIIRGFFDTPFFFSVFDFAMFMFIVDYKEQTKRIPEEQLVSIRLL